MPSELGARLSAARNARGWTLREVERRTGIHNAHLSQVETGAITRPDPNILWELARVYEDDFDQLMRLAGHVEGHTDPDVDDLHLAAAFRALKALTPEERRAAVEYLQSLRNGRHARAAGDQ